jgi:hypothetical protein
MNICHLLRTSSCLRCSASASRESVMGSVTLSTVYWAMMNAKSSSYRLISCKIYLFIYLNCIVLYCIVLYCIVFIICSRGPNNNGYITCYSNEISS